jgi:flagellar protein FlaG
MIAEGIQGTSQVTSIMEHLRSAVGGEQVAQMIRPDMAVQQEEPRKEDRPSGEPLLRALEKMAGEIDQSARFLNTHIAFSVHEETGETVIKIVDNETEEVIRQIPLEEMLTLMTRIRKMLGLLVDKKA